MGKRRLKPRSGRGGRVVQEGNAGKNDSLQFTQADLGLDSISMFDFEPPFEEVMDALGLTAQGVHYDEYTGATILPGTAEQLAKRQQ